MCSLVEDLFLPSNTKHLLPQLADRLLQPCAALHRRNAAGGRVQDDDGQRLPVPAAQTQLRPLPLRIQPLRLATVRRGRRYSRHEGRKSSQVDLLERTDV